MNILSEVRPDLVAEWIDRKNYPLTPSSVSAGSKKYAWWICNKGHEWRTMIKHRNRGSGCPYCARNRTLSGYNDLKTVFPEHTLYWLYDRNEVNPMNISPNSSIKAWWFCEKGHEYAMRVDHKTSGSRCPHCSIEKSGSFVEDTIYEELYNLLNNAVVVHGHRIDVPWGTKSFSLCDFYIPSLHVVIEFDGEYWHRPRIRKDVEKTMSLLGAGYTVIRIRERNLESLQKIISCDKYFEVTTAEKLHHNQRKSDALKTVVADIQKILYQIGLREV